MYVRADQPQDVIAVSASEQLNRIRFAQVFGVSGIALGGDVSNGYSIDKGPREPALLIENVHSRQHRRMESVYVILGAIAVGRDESGKNGAEVQGGQYVKGGHCGAVTPQLEPQYAPGRKTH